MSLIDKLPEPLRTQAAKYLNGENLRAKAARGSVWLAVGSGSEYGLRFIRQIILAKFFLPPEAFGAMAIVLAVSNLFEALTEVGIKNAVIQHPRATDQTYLNGAWFFSVARGVSLYILAFAASPFIADFYRKPGMMDLTPLLRVAFLAVFFNGAISPRAYTAQKTMNYRQWVSLYHGGGIVGVLTTLVLGYMLGNVWALVIGFVVESGSRFVLSYVFCPFVPGFDFDQQQLKDLFRYARGMLGLPIMTVLYNQSDIFVVGRVMTSEMTGYYSIAYGLAQIPNQLYGAIMVPILMSAFATMQTDNEALVRNLVRSTKYVAMVALPGFALMASAAPLVLRTLYGPEYATASVAFSIMCVTVAVRVVCRGMVTIFFATGRPHLSRQALFVRLVVVAISIVPLTHYYGLPGAALATLLSSIAGELFNFMRLRQIIGLSFSHFAGGIWQGAAASLAIAALWHLIVLVAHL